MSISEVHEHPLDPDDIIAESLAFEVKSLDALLKEFPGEGYLNASFVQMFRCCLD